MKQHASDRTGAYRRHLPELALLAAAPLAVATAHAQAPRQQIAAGREVAQRLCAQCHVVAGPSSQGWTDAPSFAAIASRPTTTPAWLARFLRTPHEKMLNFLHEPAEANALEAYILSLRRR